MRDPHGTEGIGSAIEGMYARALLAAFWGFPPNATIPGYQKHMAP